MMKNKIKIVIGQIIIGYTAFCYRSSKRGFFGRILNLLHRTTMNLIGMPYFPIESINTYNAKFNNVDVSVLRSDRDGFTANVIYNTMDVPQELYKIKLPDLCSYIFHNISIHGDSDFIIDITNGCVVNDFCYDMNPKHQLFDGALYRAGSNVAILRRNPVKISRSLPCGIMISGKFSKNYYHDVYENLIRLVVLDEVDIPKNVPLVVDDFVMNTPSLRRVLEILSSNLNREIITIGAKEIIAFETLYTISPVNHITPHIIDASTCQLSDFVFDLSVVNRMRERLLPYKSDRQFPRRLFLSRANTQHRKFNEDEVFAILEPMGFERIAPEQYSFEEQMAMFNGAEYIVGGTGAAFTNLLFCNGNCKIVCFMSFVAQAPMFNIPPYSIGCRYINIRPFNANVNKLHANFHIDIDEFSDTLQVLMSDNKQIM
jgi:hypothetical protein